MKQILLGLTTTIFFIGCTTQPNFNDIKVSQKFDKNCKWESVNSTKIIKELSNEK